MKALFAALVLLNVAFFLWMSSVAPGQDDHGRRPRSPVNPDSIRLVVPTPAAPAAVAPPAPPGAGAAATGAAPTPSSSAVPGTAAAPAVACYRLGPMYTTADLGAAEGNLQLLALSYELHIETSQPQVAGYRVSAGTFGNESAARKAAARLRKSGVREQSLVTAADGQVTVSLGVFRKQGNALTYAKELAARGIRSRIEGLKRGEPVYWLFLGQVSPASLSELDRLKFGGAEVVPADCTNGA